MVENCIQVMSFVSKEYAPIKIMIYHEDLIQLGRLRVYMNLVDPPAGKKGVEHEDVENCMRHPYLEDQLSA